MGDNTPDVIDDFDIDSFFNPERLQRHMVATGGAPLIPSQKVNHYDIEFEIEKMMSRESREDMMVKRIGINLHDYDYMSVERPHVVDKGRLSTEQIKSVVMDGLLPLDKNVTVKSGRWSRDKDVSVVGSKDHVVQPGKRIIEHTEGMIGQIYKLLFLDTGGFSSYQFPSVKEKFAKSVMSVDVDVPVSMKFCNAHGGEVEVHPHRNLSRGDAYRDVLSTAIARANMSNCLDFGSGERRYCDCMPVRLHVDIKGQQGQCDFHSSQYKCPSKVSPIVVHDDYEWFVCINSLQNLSFGAMAYLLNKLCHKKIFVIWPVNLNHDECDPMHLLQQYYPTIFFGYLGDWVPCNYSEGSTSRVFMGGYNGMSKISDTSRIFIDALNCCQPTSRNDGVLSVNVLGVFKKKLVGVVYNSSIQSKRLYCADFLVCGKVHVGETVTQALYRETKEELSADFAIKPVYCGHSYLGTSNHMVSCYYHEFNDVSEFPLAIGTDGVVRGKVMIIDEKVRLRDDYIASMRALVRIDKLDGGYVASLEARWLSIGHKGIKAGEDMKHTYYWDRYAAESLRRKITPSHCMLGYIRAEPERIRFTGSGRHHIVTVPVSVGDVVVSQVGFHDSNNTIFYNGFLHARFRITTYVTGIVTEVIEMANCSLKDSIMPLGPIWRKNNIIWYDDGPLGIEYYVCLNGLSRFQWPDHVVRAKLEEIGYCQEVVAGLPIK